MHLPPRTPIPIPYWPSPFIETLALHINLIHRHMDLLCRLKRPKMLVGLSSGAYPAKAPLCLAAS
ncbi:hypothetical protein BU26DRAFT_77560 [Trematosphaeria pertusa]|uniref:Uncharacterized protein n=1 Tax=Trematosphaeria pertusa TaxID=390896 RepID=A0A6A6I4J4_9PLEO|nr:uncharacterized protein BU26DRAFT_77560 [Trematosphaeria pertusa]KAF2245149.1 hypothetical protein BU26DRAFT_77560 [Trematosphaeria pertusa]